MTTLTINGTALAYDEFGPASGPAALLLHAFPLRGAMWHGQAAQLAAAGWRVIVPDQRGFGDAAAPPGPYPMDLLAADALALLDALGVGRFVLGGLSMGGYVGLAVLRRAPERVAAVILADTRAGADSDQTRAARESLAQAVETQGSAAAVASQLPRLLRPETLRDDADLTNQVRGWISGNDPAGIAGAARGMALRPDSTPWLAQIACPTLVLCGADDTTTPLAESETLRDGIPGARLAVIPTAAHLSNLENAPAFDAALLAFMGAVGTEHG